LDGSALSPGDQSTIVDIIPATFVSAGLLDARRDRGANSLSNFKPGLPDGQFAGECRLDCSAPHSKTHADDVVDRVAEFNCHQYGRADNKIETEMHNSLDPDIVVGLALFRARRETKLKTNW
jgi:hypothetical protein